MLQLESHTEITKQHAEKVFIEMEPQIKKIAVIFARKNFLDEDTVYGWAMEYFLSAYERWNGGGVLQGYIRGRIRVGLIDKFRSYMNRKEKEDLAPDTFWTTAGYKMHSYDEQGDVIETLTEDAQLVANLILNNRKQLQREYKQPLVIQNLVSHLKMMGWEPQRIKSTTVEIVDALLGRDPERNESLLSQVL